MGITYVDQQLPILPPTVYPEPRKEPELTYGDSVQVVLRVLKNGIVRVKVNGAIADMYAKYYGPGVDHSKVAPFKAVLQAYKAHGFSKEFLDRITKNNDKRKAIQIRIDKVFTTIFDKEPVKKAKKEKKKKVEEIIEDIEEVITEAVEPEEDADKPLAPDAPEEDETLDVEPDEDEEEEEYVSDGE
jgi:molecular chaperone DnaK (HSP70)